MDHNKLVKQKEVSEMKLKVQTIEGVPVEKPKITCQPKNKNNNSLSTSTRRKLSKVTLKRWLQPKCWLFVNVFCVLGTLLNKTASLRKWDMLQMKIFIFTGQDRVQMFHNFGGLSKLIHTSFSQNYKTLLSELLVGNLHLCCDACNQFSKQN